MDIDKPIDSGFTIYSKSGCPNCLKSKALLKEKNLLFKVIDCDDVNKNNNKKSNNNNKKKFPPLQTRRIHGGKKRKHKTLKRKY